MKSSKFFALAIAIAMFVGCQHLPPNKAMEGSGWTQGLQAAGISGSLDDLARPRDYTIHQVSGGGTTTAPGETGRILADLQGPGCIVRLYAADPQGNVHVYIDGAEAPQYSGPFKNLFFSTFPSYGEPLTDVVGGGSYTYVPIPFASSCKIVQTGSEPSNAYQVTYASFEETQQLTSFMIDKLDGADKNYFAHWSDGWDDGTEIRRYDRDSEVLYHTSKKVYPHNDVQLFALWESATITEIEMEVGSFDDATMRNVWLAIYWDGEKDPAVLAPLGGFFGSVLDPSDNFGGPAFGQEDGRMYLRFPMPYKHKVQMRLINATDSKIDLAYWITYAPGEPSLKRYFHARYNEDLTMPGEAYTVAKLNGAGGHFVGCAVATEGGSSHFNLAGGETITVDNAHVINGTSTGAYFNAGWDFDGQSFSRPSHGLSATGDVPGAYHASAYRVHFSDAISFDDSFSFEFNHGPNNTEAGLRYASVAFWYLDRPAREGSLWTVPGLALGDHQPQGGQDAEDRAAWGEAHRETN